MNSRYASYYRYYHAAGRYTGRSAGALRS